VVVPGEWELVGGDPAPGEPATYADLAHQFGRTAEAAGEAHDRLKKIQDQVNDAIWRGKSADAFRERIEELPEKLEKLHASYDKASSALREYGTKLREFQTRAAAIVGDAGRAHQDETAEQVRLDQARALDPATPTAVQEDAVEAARQRLRSARDQIDQIREERQGAESHVLSGLDNAGDLGIHNKSWLVKTLRAIADAAEFVSIVLAVLAIAVVVVVLLSNPVGWATLGAALAAAGPLFSASTAAATTGLIVKIGAKFAGDDDLTAGELVKEGVILGGTFGFARVLEVAKLTQIRTMTMEFRQMTTEVRPIMRLVTASDDLLLTQVRTTVQITRVDMVRTVTTPLHLNTVWDTGLAARYHIPKYLNEHPEVARVLRQRPPAGVVMAGTGRPGGPPAVTLAQTPMPAGAR
jgi:uncharacterized protein YukE